MSCKTVYITTPIYYVNDVPHIGHAYTTIIGDALARYSKLVGHEVFFLTGTDEHGQKIAESAETRGKTPKEYADEISGKFRALWDEFEISYDHFIRTTDEAHKQGVQQAFSRMLEKGDIYKGEYEGHYCVSCETYFTKRQLIEEEGCPECSRPTRIIKEESYFFALSRYEQKLLDWYEQNPDCILPKSRKNEVISFVKEGLNDLSITRTSFDWGVHLPESLGDSRHVMYVWLDALMNYITALGYGGDEEGMRFWPAKVHLVGKDILRFHAVYWPAFLMSLGLPLPKHIAAHGWWTRNGAKMSKSVGNVVNPKEVTDAYGLEPFRYFLLREVPFGQDGDFSQKALVDRINSDLSNDLGNLLNRVIGMSGKYFDSKIVSHDVQACYPKELDELHASMQKLPDYLYEMHIHRYLEELWVPLSLANRCIDHYKPWEMMKNSRDKEAMALIALIANILAKVVVMLSPVMPKSCENMAKALQFEINQESYQRLVCNEELLTDFVVEKIPPVFPRIEELLMPDDVAKAEAPKENTSASEKQSGDSGLISIDQFFTSQIKIGRIVEAEEVPKSDKLLKIQVDIGETKPRQVIAGIRLFYTPDSLVGTQVCMVANLKPAKLMGHLSEGMLLAAKDGEGLSLIRPEQEKAVGTLVK